MKRSILLIAIAALALLAVPALAQEVEPTQPPPPICPAFEDESKEVRTSYYMGEGLAYYNTGQLGNAELSFTCVIRVIDSSYVLAYMSRASVYSERRAYDLALVDYNRAIQLSPDMVAAYNNRGVVYTALQEYDKAAADFDKAIDLDSSYIPGYNNRAVVYAIQGEFDEAITMLEQAIDMSGIDDVLAKYQDPNRAPDAPPIEFDPVDARAYALLGIIYSARSLDQFQDYLFLYDRAGEFPDERVRSAAGALESRFTFEMRLEDGSWMLVADLFPEAEQPEASQ